MSNPFTQQFQKINEILKSSRKILVASHENPDPDAVASSLIFNHVFKKKNLECLPFLPDLPPKNLSYLPGFFEIQNKINSFEPDTLFCLDYGDFKRLRLPEHILNRKPLSIITIDHHLESDQRGEVKVLNPEFSSTSEIIYHWLKYENISIDKEIADCLLTGIFSDSGGFCHVCTSPETLNIVSELLSKGVSLNKIAQRTLYFNKPLSLSQAWGHVLSRTQLDKKTGLAYSWINLKDFKRFGVDFADFDGITNLVSGASSLNLGLFLIEYEEGKIKGSLRSEPNGRINVVDIARAFGGGGHYYAAGFQQEGTIENVLKKVLNLIR